MNSKEWKGLINEIQANKSMRAENNEIDKAHQRGWNEGADMAIRFIKNYEAGQGLFQETSNDQE